MVKENQVQGEMVNARRPCFFEIFSSNFTVQRLRIPVNFVKHLEGRTSGSVSLTGPSGNIWSVDLIQRDDNVFLDHGWTTFVRDHLIECGDLLVFRYDGDLCFTVQVFDQTACEKESAFESKCSEDPSKFSGSTREKRGREEGAASSDRSLECVPKKIRQTSSEFHLECLDRNQEAGLDSSDQGRCEDDEAIMTKPKQCGSPLKNSAMHSQSKACNEKPEAAIRKRIGEEDDVNLPHRGYVSILLEREKRVAQSFISCFPYFVRIMKKFNISGSYTLNIPYQFTMAHLPNCRTEIVLRTVKGACWTVNSVPTTRVHTSHTFCGGWMAFVRSNDIKMGDICIFELVRKLELRVFILRVGKDAPENQSVTLASNGRAATSHKTENFRKKSRKNTLKVHSTLIKAVEICDKKGSKKSQASALPNHIRKHSTATNSSVSAVLCSESKTDTSVQGGKNVEGALGSQAAGMRMMVSLDEAKAAKSFTSCFPYFVRIMRKFNISGSYTLKIPHRFSAAHLPNCKTEIVLRNTEGECWTVNSVPDSKGRTVHTFCGGWMAFVRDNDVKMGDICIFELVSNCEMHVHVSGVGRKVLDHPPL